MSMPDFGQPLPIAATISNVTRQTGLSRSEICRLLARGKLRVLQPTSTTRSPSDRPPKRISGGASRQLWRPMICP